LLLVVGNEQKQILRYAQDDIVGGFFFQRAGAPSLPTA